MPFERLLLRFPPNSRRVVHFKTVQWNVIIIITYTMTIITVVAVVDDDTYYRVYMSSDHTFQVYYKVRQLILLQSATAFLLQSAATVITKRDRYYKVRQNTVLSKVIFFFLLRFYPCVVYEIGRIYTTHELFI